MLASARIVVDNEEIKLDNMFNRRPYSDDKLPQVQQSQMDLDS